MKHRELLIHQHQLLLRNEQLRIKMADQLQVLRAPLAVADQAQRGLQWLCRNPHWPIGALVLLLVLRPRRAALWGGRWWWIWKTFKKTRDWLAKRLLSPQ
jgi:hypothetical protein